MLIIQMVLRTCIGILGNWYLDMIIDSNLKFKDHIDYMIKKINNKIEYFGRIRSKLTKNCHSSSQLPNITIF